MWSSTKRFKIADESNNTIDGNFETALIVYQEYHSNFIMTFYREIPKFYVAKIGYELLYCSQMTLKIIMTYTYILLYPFMSVDW